MHRATIDLLYSASSQVTLRLRNKGWFSSRHCLIFGERELLGHEIIGDIAKQAPDSSQYKHIFLKLADLESVSVSTLKRDVAMPTAATGSATPRSTLNSLLSSSLASSEEDQR